MDIKANISPKMSVLSLTTCILDSGIASQCVILAVHQHLGSVNMKAPTAGNTVEAYGPITAE